MKSFETDYLPLIPGANKTKPLFTAAVEALTRGFTAATNLALGLPAAFDLDSAVGAQLDDVGRWVGAGRTIPQPLTGLYFTWDDNNLGWEKGYLQGPFDPSTGLISVDDVTFRAIIRAKIAANSWDGSLAGMYDALTLAFGLGAVVVQDNQDMSITLVYDTTILSPIFVQLLTSGFFKLKPDGVRITYVAKSSAPLMSFDRSLPKFQGWNGVAVWA